jgi:hypothetical protein
MNHPASTGHRVQHAEDLVSWTGRERLRILWYRLRLIISEMNYASRRMVELQLRLPPKVADRAAARIEEILTCVVSAGLVNGAFESFDPAR